MHARGFRSVDIVEFPDRQDPASTLAKDQP
jgi:hypothetical protein